MKKEVIIAVIIGLIMGLIITYGFYRVKTTVTAPPTTDLENTVASASATPKVISTIAIHSPEEGHIQENSELKVAGTTTASSIIILNYEEESLITESDSSGNFSFDIELSDGPHIITVSVLENDGSVTTEDRTVVITDIFKPEEDVSDADQVKESDEQTEETTSETEEDES